MREMKDSGIEWVGEIPEEWTKDKAIRLFNIIGSGTTPKNITSDFPCVNWIQSGDINGSLISSCKNNVSESIISQYGALKIYAAPFIVIAMYGASVGNTSISLIDGCVNQACCVLSASIYNLNYAFYAIKSSQNYLIRKAIGGGQPNISQDTIKQLWLPLPALHEQERIAAFLDAECAEIDAVLEKTRASIEEYKKLKQAVITQAVTKGVRGDRPMKDSGIEWIGDIPAEWDVVRIKNLFDYRNERNFKPLEEVNLISLYTDKGVVQHCDLDETTGNKASNADGYKLVYENDIVVNIILCWMGAIGRSAYFGVTSPAYDVYSPKQKTNSKFYHYLFRTNGFSGDCYKVGRGIMAMRWRTYSDQFRAIKVVSPPQSEQEEIVEYLDEKCEGIDDLIAKKQQYLTEIENYKKSLIYEYVTGKKEVV